MGYGFDDNSSASSRSRRSASSRVKKPNLVSSRSLPNKGNSKPMSLNNKTKQEALQRQAQLYAELAKELEEKLSKRNTEIMALRRSNQVLQKENAGHKSKISTLETQCIARSAKVAQLSDSIANRKNGKVQERLVEKSLEIADLVEENERLKIQKQNLQEDKSRNGKLLLEMCEIVRMLNQIDVSYDKAGDDGESGCYSNMFYPTARYSPTASGDLPQDIPMENVRRKITAIEEAIREKEELRKENALQKQKLDILREKNSDLNFEISSLESKLRDHQEQAQGWGHPQQHRSISQESSKTWSNDSQRSDHTFSTSSFSDSSREPSFSDSSREPSFSGDFVVEGSRTSSEDPSEDTGIQDSYRESDSRDYLFSPVHGSLSTVDELNSSEDEESENTSFSSLEAPPSQDDEEDEQSEKSTVKEQTVRPEEHKQLQNNFEKALDVIEKLKEDLSRSTNANGHGNAYQRDFEKASKEVERLGRELEEAVNKYTMLKGEHKALCDRHEEDLEASRRVRDDLEATHKEKLFSLEQASKANIDDLTKRNKNLELQYNDLETEYTTKIESLEQKLKEMKHQHKLRRDDSASKCENLEEEVKNLRQELKKLREEYDAIESVQQERVDTLLEEHDKNVTEEKKKFDDLRYEYDTFLEIHLKLEEDAEQARERYKDSLIKIRTLEAEAKAGTVAAEKTKAEHQKATEDANAAHQEAIEQSKMVHQQEVKKLEATIMEWKGKLMKLKRDHVSAVKSHNEATQKFIAEIKQIKKDHGVVMAKQGRMRQNDAAKYQKLRRDYDTALVEYGKREQITIHKFEQSKCEYESKIRDCQKKIKEFEKLAPLSKKNAMKEKMDQLVETNQKLNEHSTKCERELEQYRRCQEQATADYKELVASYQASLLKIESLMQNQEEKTSEDTVREETKQVKTGKGGTVMERIKQLEKKSEEKSSQPKPQKKTQSGFDSGFQKDFEMIVSKLGLDSSQEDSNLEASSVVSGAGSSVAGSAIFDAIFKRVEEHALKMEVTKTMESAVPQTEEHPQKVEVTKTVESPVPQTTTTMSQSSEVAHIYDVLHHFIQMSEVNASFRKLPQFQKQYEDDQNSEESVVNLNELGNVNETISNLLVHRKRFESVQSSLMRQIVMTQLDELYPSTLIGLFPSEYGSSPGSISPSDLGFSSANINVSTQDEETRTYDASSSPRSVMIRKEIHEEARLRDESFSMQLHMSTEEIRSKAREKEMRLLNLKYQNLREEFEEIKLGKMPLPPTDIAIPTDDASSYQPSIGMSSVTTPAIQGMKQIEGFQKKVLHAELKAALTKRECEQRKSQLILARKEQGKIETNFKTPASLLNDVEDVEESSDKIIQDEKALLPKLFDVVPNQVGNLSWELEAPSSDSNEELDAFNNKNTTSFSNEDQFSVEVTNLSPSCTSDESDDCTSNDESRPVSTASLEAQDGKPVSFGSFTKGTKETAEETDDYSGESDSVECENDSNDESSESKTSIENNENSESNNSIEDNPKKNIDAIQLELKQAKSAAEAARRKQLEREQNLRDVIFHYKKLQKQHEEALTEKQKPSKWKRRKGDSTSNLEKDLKQAHENVTAVKRELKEACEQHSEEKEHLRDVMGQFQNLQADFLKVLAEKQELEKAVYQRPDLGSGVVPASISIGPHPRFLDSSGSWVASTIGGVSFEGTSTDSSKHKSQRPVPDGSPLRKVAGPPQRPNHVSSCKIVELCDRDRVFRPQVDANPALTPPRFTKTVHATQNSDHTTRTSSLTTHSSATVRGAHLQQKSQLPHQHQPRQHQPRQQQQQQQQLKNKQLQGQKRASQLQQRLRVEPPSTKSSSKRKKGIFRGWRKQKLQSGESLPGMTTQ